MRLIIIVSGSHDFINPRVNGPTFFTSFVNFLLLFVRFIAFLCVEYYHLNAF